MDKAVNTGALTENGKAAFIAAMDPFHDLQIQHLRGWPDANTAPSVIRCVKQSTTVKSNGDGDNIMIFTWPILNRINTYRCSRRNAIVDDVSPSVSTDFELGSVTVWHYADIADMTLTNGTFAHTFALEDDYLYDSCRCIGMGVEVRDVTAELYKQGTLTTFQVPQSTVEPSTWFVHRANGPYEASPTKSKSLTPAPMAPQNLPTPVQVTPLKKFPTTMDDVLTLEGTRQWDAQQGAYVVVPFHGRDNFAGQPTYNVPAIYDTTYNAGERTGTSNNAGNVNLGAYASPVIDQDPLVFLANKMTPVDSKGILLTGLNEKSTFTINVIFYLESFPAPDNRPLLSLARPSAPEDNLALEMISVATQHLPIAVPVDENGLGDWFAEVVAEVAPWIEAAGGALGVPLVATAAKAAGAAANSYMAGSTYKPSACASCGGSNECLHSIQPTRSAF